LNKSLLKPEQRSDFSRIEMPVWRHLLDKGENNSSSGFSSAQRRSFRNMCHNICQVTQETGDVICALTCPKEFDDELLTHNPDGPKNLLLLLSSFENKFDSGDFCFLPTTIPNSELSSSRNEDFKQRDSQRKHSWDQQDYWRF
jgi:hypothetical protein